MQVKYPLFLISLFTIILAATLLLSGCGNMAATLSPVPSPSFSPKPSSSPAPPPNPTPAIFKLSNLRAMPSPEDGANAYLFYVDVQNTGGQSGTYQASYRIDNKAAKDESKKITVNPGQKRSLELIGPGIEVFYLGQDYDNGVITERQHTVSVGDLSLPITLAERYKLALISSSIENADGNITVSGDVKNISSEKMERIMAVADIRVTDLKVMWIFKTAEAPVAYESVIPGQTTPFKVVIPNTIPNNLEVVGYRVTFKNAAGAPIRASSPSP